MNTEYRFGDVRIDKLESRRSIVEVFTSLPYRRMVLTYLSEKNKIIVIIPERLKAAALQYNLKDSAPVCCVRTRSNGRKIIEIAEQNGILVPGR